MLHFEIAERRIQSWVSRHRFGLLGREKAVCVGHDWGSPVVWNIASHHPDRCHAVANLCVPYLPNGFAPKNLIPLVDRAIYPEAQFPAGQWEYMLFYEENFEHARAGFEGNIAASVKAMFRAGGPEAKGAPAITAHVRNNKGWFGPLHAAPDFPRDETVITEEDFHRASEEVIRDLASAGRGVILGRGAVAALREETPILP